MAYTNKDILLTTTTHEFEMDRNLLISVIKSQAGSLGKALLEGVMNSIDAGTSRVDVLLDQNEFTIIDSGRGFQSEEEIRSWFGRFGTPHQDGDATFGRFRMGRGQLFAFASTTWRSGRFVMEVDIEEKGLSYDLRFSDEVVKGCVVKGKLYQPLSSYKLADTLTALRKLIAFAPKPVYVNGEMFGGPAKRLKNWTFEDDDAYYRLVPASHELQVYNQGVLVEDMATWRVGMGGIVVSKRPLEVNFARNEVLEDKCLVWKRIAKQLETQVLHKLSESRKLEDSERRYLARRLPLLMSKLGSKALDVKVLTDPTGKHLALRALQSYRRFVYVEQPTPAACAAHGKEGIFVVTDSLLTRFGVSSLGHWLDLLLELPYRVLNHQFEVLEARNIGRFGLGAAEAVARDDLTARDKAALDTLGFLNEQLAKKLIAAGSVHEARELRVGRHKKSDFVAWTDGKTYVTANRRYFKQLEQGLDGMSFWLQVLVHEYTHDTDDSESHSHGEVFYQKFHDTMLSSALGLGGLAQAGLAFYLEALSHHGVSRPHALTRQLRPTLTGRRALQE